MDKKVGTLIVVVSIIGRDTFQLEIYPLKIVTAQLNLNSTQLNSTRVGVTTL